MTLDAFRKAAKGGGAPEPYIMVTTDVGDLFARRGGRPNASGAAVLAAITDRPGHTGAQVAELCPHIHERTVRTALRRLRIAGKIEQRDSKWFAVSGGT